MHLVMIGGSDAGISAALRARELDPAADVTVVLADGYPNFSICGIPYYLSGEVTHWRNLAHRTVADLEATGMRLRLDTTARRIDVPGRKLLVSSGNGDEVLGYDKLVVGTGAVPTRPAIIGLGGPDALGPGDGVHLLHSMGDTFAVMRTLEQAAPASAVIVGAGYIGLEMADALTVRGLRVTQMEQLPEVLPTVDEELGALVRDELTGHGVEVLTGTTVRAITRAAAGRSGRLDVQAADAGGTVVTRTADMVLVVVGVRPDTALAAEAGATLGVKGAIAVDPMMRTGLPDVYAAGDCVITLHRLLGETYLPLGTTAHKQGRVAGENALGGSREFAGSLGTQVVKIFDQATARTGLRDHEAATAGFDPVTTETTADDHKAYYPGSHRIAIRVTGDRATGRLLGMQLFGHKDAEIAKRVDIAAAAIFNNMTVDAVSDLDLSYTPPLGSPWDAVQTAAQAWTRSTQERWSPGRLRPVPNRDDASWVWLFSGERPGRGAGGARGAPGTGLAVPGGTADHDDVTSSWSGQRRCDIVVVVAWPAPGGGRGLRDGCAS
jgi:NADPH-dependent 2,4-dienoyl-CoA reductase/sulfur reductase-like enzyme